VRGGGLFTEDTTTLTRCTFTNNSLTATSNAANGGAFGGAIEAEAAVLTLNSCDFQQNTVSSTTAGAYGGGVGSAGHVHATNCRFEGNQVSAPGVARGGAFFASGSFGEMVNTVFVLNKASGTGPGSGTGAAVDVATGSGYDFTNCDFVLNMASGATSAGGAFHVAGGSPVTLANSIAYADSAASGAEIALESGGTMNVSYSDVRGGVEFVATDGGHNIDAPPSFVRAPATNGILDFGDLHLQPASPCVNAGNASALNIPAMDIDGRKRIQGPAPDMGVDEVGDAALYDIYVDKVAGDDQAGVGTAAAPFETVAKALAQITNPLGLAVIHVKQGNYSSDRPRVNTFVKFVNWTGAGRASIGKQ
jgi:hypothetical protein